LPPGRASDYYGQSSHTWSPYRPTYSRPLAAYALELAKKCLDCEPRFEAFENETPPQAGHGLTPPGLYLVDAWVTLSDTYRDRLRALNQITEPWVSILVPWNSQDEGMHAAGKDLRQKLHEHLPRKLDGVPRRCRMAADGIPTMHDFSQLLPDMTMIMLKRFRKAAPARPPEGPPLGRPRLRQAGPDEFGGLR
jgi:FxsC-like protein